MENSNKLYLTSDEGVLLDPNYRYKICIPLTTIMLKKGTYITILDNFSRFCVELMVEHTFLIKVLGKLLSCKSGVNKNNDYYLQGRYSAEEIKSKLYLFIQKYLLCVNCDKPEIGLKYKHSKIKQKCRACGNNSYLDNCNEEIVQIFSKT